MTSSHALFGLLNQYLIEHRKAANCRFEELKPQCFFFLDKLIIWNCLRSCWWTYWLFCFITLHWRSFSSNSHRGRCTSLTAASVDRQVMQPQLVLIVDEKESKAPSSKAFCCCLKNWEKHSTEFCVSHLKTQLALLYLFYAHVDEESRFLVSRWCF